MNRRSFLGAAAAAPFAARASIAHATAGRSRALALVTADAERRVVVVDLASGDVIKRIAVGAGPRSIEAVADGRLAVVGHFNDRLISIIDLRTLRLVGEIGDIGEPRYTAAHRDGRHAHVTDSARGELVTVDLVKRRIVARVNRQIHGLWLSLGGIALKLRNLIKLASLQISANQLEKRAARGSRVCARMLDVEKCKRPICAIVKRRIRAGLV